MSTKSQIEQQVSDALSVPGRMQAVEPNPFLYGKIMHRMQQPQPASTFRLPKWSVAITMLLLVLNGFTFTFLAVKSKSRTNEKTVLINMMNEYGLSSQDYSY